MFGHVIELKLLLHPLIVHVTLSASRSEVDRQMVSHVDDLCHILHIVTESLSGGAHHMQLITWT